MKKNLLSFCAVISILSIVLIQCGTENKEVILKVKFNENQSLSWSSSYKDHMEYFEDDSLILVKDEAHETESVEEVISLIDKNTARLRLTTYFDMEIPDKDDSTKTIAVKDSSIIEYIQDSHSVNLDFFLSDTSSSEKTEYIKKLFEQLAPRYPDEPVSVGYKWTNNITVMLQDGKTQDAITTYTVKGFVKEFGYDCVIIESKGNTIVPFQKEFESKKEKGTVLISRIDTRETKTTTYMAYKEGFIVKEDKSFEFLSEGTKVTAEGEVKTKIISNGSESYFLIDAKGI